MPIKLIEPSKERRTPYYSGRGTHRGVYVNRSTQVSDRRKAKQIIRDWEEQIERGEYGRPAAVVEAPKGETTFAEASIAYMNAGGERRFLAPAIRELGEKPLSQLDQVELDAAAVRAFPKGTSAYRNRNFYTPVSAVLKHVGVERAIKRPKGWRGKKSQSWLEPEQAFPLIANCYKVDPEFGLLCLTYLYTGERLNEPLKASLRHLKLDVKDKGGKPAPLLYIPDTKNGDPRPVHIPPLLAAAFRAQPPRPERPRKADGVPLKNGAAGRSQTDAGVPFLERSQDAKLFRFRPSGHLRKMLKEAMKMTGLRFPHREGGFHIFCHTYGTWMTRYGGLDTVGLTRTGRWKSTESAERYNHTVASAEARMADLFPTPPVLLKVLK